MYSSNQIFKAVTYVIDNPNNERYLNKLDNISLSYGRAILNLFKIINSG